MARQKKGLDQHEDAKLFGQVLADWRKNLSEEELLILEDKSSNVFDEEARIKYFESGLGKRVSDLVRSIVDLSVVRGPSKRLSLEDQIDLNHGVFDPADMPRKLPGSERMNVMQALEYLSHNVWRAQRKVPRPRFAELTSKMIDGRFHGSDIAICKLNFNYTAPDGSIHREILVNGQTTCYSVIAAFVMSKGVVTSVEVTRKIFTGCTDEKQVATCWAQFDQPGGNRTPSQMAVSYISDFPNMTTGVLRLLVSSLSHKYGVSDKSYDEKIQLLYDESNQESNNFVVKILGMENGLYSHLKSICHRQGCVLSMIDTFNKDPEAAEEFWVAVRTGTTLEGESLNDLALKGTPVQVLHKWLAEDIVVGNTSGRGVGGKKKKLVSTEEIYCRSNQMWNAFRQGVQSISLRKPPKEVPEAI